MATAATVLRPTSPASPDGAWLRWTAVVSLAEIVAVAIPLTLGVIASEVWGLGGFGLWGIIAAAGAAQGLVLGIGQSFAVKRFLPGINQGLWIAATFIGVALAWAFAWLPPTYVHHSQPAGVVAGIAIVAMFVGLIALTVPQAEVLAWAKVRNGYMWVAFSAVAWSIALPALFIGGLFVDGGSSAGELIGAFAVGGVAMAVLMAAVTGRGMLWLAEQGITEE